MNKITTEDDIRMKKIISSLKKDRIYRDIFGYEKRIVPKNIGIEKIYYFHNRTFPHKCGKVYFSLICDLK